MVSGSLRMIGAFSIFLSPPPHNNNTTDAQKSSHINLREGFIYYFR
jgi:hypothetical protein